MKLPKLLRTKFKVSRKVLVILIVLIGIAGGIFYYSNRNKTPIIQTVQVKRQDIKTSVSASGSLAPRHSANLKFKISGKLNYLNVEEGDQISEGQILAELDTTEQSILYQQAQNTYRDKQAAVDKIIDDIHLFQYGNGGFSNVGTQNETSTQRQLRTSAEALRDNAYDSLTLAQRSFEDTILTSPLSGVVTQANILPGQFISPADIVIQIIDNTQNIFDAEIDEADIISVQIGQEAEVTLNSYPNQTFKGTVTKILPSTKTTSSGATVVIARIAIKDPIVFKSGLNGQAVIITKQVGSTLVIPTESLIDEDTVYVKTDRGFEKVKIKKGIASETEVEVKEGLIENQEIITNPSALNQK